MRIPLFDFAPIREYSKEYLVKSREKYRRWKKRSEWRSDDYYCGYVVLAINSELARRRAA